MDLADKTEREFARSGDTLTGECTERGILDMGLLVEPVDIARYEFIRMPQKERWGVLAAKDSPLPHTTELARRTWRIFRDPKGTLTRAQR